LESGLKAEKEQTTDAEELLALSCLKPEAAPVFFSLVKRAPAALELVRTNPVLFALLAFDLSQREMPDEDIVELLGRKKRELVGFLGGIGREAGVRFMERFEVPGNYREFERTVARISDEELMKQSFARPLREVFKARRYFEAAPELREIRAFHAELSESTRTIGPSATARLLTEIQTLGRLQGRDFSGEIARSKNGAALDALYQRLIALVHESAPELLLELPSYPRKFPRAPIGEWPTIVQIVDEGELQEEARAMNHCALTMVHEFLKGDAFLFRVLEPERATLKIKKAGHRLVIEELKLVNNDEPSQATYAAVEEWLDGSARIASSPRRPEGERG
jgi:hypothetical protein